MNFPVGQELREGRQVQVEPTVALAVARATTLREGHATVGIIAIIIPAVVVAALVTPQGLPGRERLVADGTLVGPTARAAGAGRSRWVVVVVVVVVGGGGVLGGGGGGLAVTGLVAAEGLVGREGFVADRALVGELQGRWLRRRRRIFGGGRAAAAAGKHDEAECKILFLGRWRWVLDDTGSFGALPLRPRLGVLQALHLFFVVERSGGGGGRIQSFQGHVGQWVFFLEKKRNIREKECVSECVEEETGVSLYRGASGGNGFGRSVKSVNYNKREERGRRRV
jgi:hypothetical protein